mmetsp:Transcript_12730/g.47008  ORF Transcript_12730/g.47008 Transcript_12730/m.47008 type:complete len:142 (-) Transcript_12730:1665-2090(-)
MRGLKFVGSLRKVISRTRRNSFMPATSVSGACAVVSSDGVPEYTMTRSARYVAMMKSCSTTKAVFFECMMNLLMTLDAAMRCSLSKYADGSSTRYTSAGLPKARTIATRWSSPPERFCTPWSMMVLITMGLITSETNCGCT